MALPPLEQIVNNSFVVGAGTLVVGFISGQLLPGFAKEWFAERERRRKHKLNVAIEVHKICNEIKTGNYRTLPRDWEHVNSVLTDVEGVDEKMGVVMAEFLELCQDVFEDYLAERGDLPERGVSTAKEKFQNYQKVENKRKILVKWSNKLRTGK